MLTPRVNADGVQAGNLPENPIHRKGNVKVTSKPFGFDHSIRIEISNLKHQITNKFQIPIFNDQNFHQSCIEFVFIPWFAGYNAVGETCRRIICLKF